MNTPQQGVACPDLPDPTLGYTAYNNGHAQQQPGFAPPGYPPPATRRAGYPPPGYPAPQPPRRRPWIPLTIVGVVLLLIVGTVVAILAVSGTRSSKDLVENAINDAATWPAVTYRGTMTNLGRDAVDIDVTVVKGELAGTLSRPDGGRAEIARDSRGMVLKGNKQWWAAGSYTSYSGRFEDVWISDPAEQYLVQQLAALDPADLKSSLRTYMPFMYTSKPTSQQLDDKDVLVVDGMGRRVFVNASSPHELVAIDGSSYASPKPEPLRATKADEAAATRVRGSAAKVRSSESPKTTSQKMSERPDIDATVTSEVACPAGICATITVTNSGTGRMVGTLEMMANGSSAGTSPLDLAPGRSTTVQTTVPAATRQPIYWSFYSRESG